MLAPILHIWTEADIDITERCMTIVAWTAQHRILSIDLLWEEDAVTVEWQESILTLIELLEVEGVSNTDCWSVITVTPSNPITVLNPCNTWVILVF